MNLCQRSRPAFLRTTPLFLITLCALGTPFAPARAEKVDARSDEILAAMTKYLQNADSLECDVISLTRILHGPTNKESSTKGGIVFDRPNKLSVEVIGGEIPFRLVSDGSQVVTFIPPMGGYTVDPSGETVSALMAGLGEKLLSKSLTFAPVLLTADPYAFLVGGASEVEYIGTSDLGGISAHQIRVDRVQVVYDVFIDEGDRPLLRKIVPDMTDLEARMRPQNPDIEISLVIDFTNWKTGEKPSDEAFAFAPPEWAKRVETFMNSRPRQDAALDLIGKEVPDFEVELMDGGKFDLAKSKDKILILEFWASWCPPCVMSLPIVGAVAEDYKSKGVEFIAINVEGAGPAMIQNFLNSRDLDIPVGIDTTQRASMSFKVGPIPQTVIVKDGIVQTVHLGLVPDKEFLSRDLDTLLAGGTLEH